MAVVLVDVGKVVVVNRFDKVNNVRGTRRHPRSSVWGCSMQAYVKPSGPFAFYQDAHVNPILSAMHPNSTRRWRVNMRAFTGDELQQGILPPWVHDAVMRGKVPPMSQTHKVSFTLEAVGALRSHIAVQVRRENLNVVAHIDVW